MSHADLVQRAVRWLQNSKGCSVVFSEFSTGAWETPDAIGFKWHFSTLVECKVSRADFFADSKKPFRRLSEKGMGAKRYFMTPKGLVKLEELPPKWGLLEVNGRHVKIVRESEGFAARCRMSEMLYLVSMLRRAQLRIDQPLSEWLRMEEGRKNDLPAPPVSHELEGKG